MSTLLFELRPPACCKNNAPIPSSDLYPNTICEKCFTANLDFPFSPESVYSIVQQHRCRVCGNVVTKSIYTRSHSYPTLTLNLNEVLNLLLFRDLPFDYTQCDYNKTVVMISSLANEGISPEKIFPTPPAHQVRPTYGDPRITANLTFMPETRRAFIDRLDNFKKRNSRAPFSLIDRIALGLCNDIRRRQLLSEIREYEPSFAATPGGPRS